MTYIQYVSNLDTFQRLLELEISPEYDRHKRREQLYELYVSLEYPCTARCRESFVGWCYKIVDLHELYFNREVVDIALSYLDEYLYKKGAGIFDNDENNGEQSVQGKRLKMSMVSSACLFLAIKVHESNHQFDIPALVQFSSGQFTAQDIVEVERDILIVLDFRLSPPTIMSFVRLYLAIVKGSGSTIDEEVPLSKEAINHVAGLAKFLSELSMYDIFFADKDVSKIALACVLTAFEGISRDDFPQAYRQRLVDFVFNEGKLNCVDEVVYKCRIKLRSMFQARHPGSTPNKQSTVAL